MSFRIVLQNNLIGTLTCKIWAEMKRVEIITEKGNSIFSFWKSIAKKKNQLHKYKMGRSNLSLVKINAEVLVDHNLASGQQYYASALKNQF